MKISDKNLHNSHLNRLKSNLKKNRLIPFVSIQLTIVNLELYAISHPYPLTVKLFKATSLLIKNLRER